MEDIWEQHKPNIYQYWIVENKNLEEVAEVMRIHGLNRKPKSYERKFRQWGSEFSKNRRGNEWKAVGLRLGIRKKSGKQSLVYVRGKAVPEAKLAKEISRYCLLSAQERNCEVALNPTTPEGFEIRTPSPSPVILNQVSTFMPLAAPNISDALRNIPWHNFLDALRSKATAPSAALDRFVGVIGRSALEKQVYGPREKSRLYAIIPSDTKNEQSIVTHNPLSPGLQLIGKAIYLISNNAMEIPDELLLCLEDSHARDLLLSLLRMKTLNTRAFANKLFKAGAYAKNERVISMLEDNMLLDAWRHDSGATIRIAIECGFVDLAIRLLNAGAITRGRFGFWSLLAAVENGNAKLVHLLIEAGADLNHADHARSPLGLAVSLGNVQLVSLLAKAGADVNAPIDEVGYRPLQAAVIIGNTEIIELVLKWKANINASSATNVGPLTIAILRNHFEVTKILLEAGAAVKPTSKPMPAVNTSNEYHTALKEALTNEGLQAIDLLRSSHISTNCSALFIAVSTGKVQIVQRLLDAGAVVNMLYFYHYTPTGLLCTRCMMTALHEAVYLGNLVIVEQLLDRRADIDIKAGRCSTRGEGGREVATLEFAKKRPHAEIIRRLLRDASGSICATGSYALLYAAIELSDISILRHLLDAGADLNVVPINCLYGSILQESIRRGKGDIVGLLLELGADINSPGNKFFGTALQEAAKLGDLDLTRHLLAAGANVNAPASGQCGKTTLQWAIWNGHHELVQSLLRACADTNAPSNDANLPGTALGLAVWKDDYLHARILIQAGAAVNPSLRSQHSYMMPLHVGARVGNLNMVKLLLDEGADVNAGLEDERGTALQAAAKAGNLEIVKLLLRRGANVDGEPKMWACATALHEAIIGSHNQIASLLLFHGANPNIPGRISDPYYCLGTPLQSALDAKNPDLVVALLQYGAQANIIPSDLEDIRTPFRAALGTSDERLIMMILETGVDVNLPDRYSCGGTAMSTALLAAIGGHRVDIVERLLHAKADVSMEGEELEYGGEGLNILPLQFAVSIGNIEISRLLMDAGASSRVTSGFYFDYETWNPTHRDGTLLAVAISQSGGQGELVDLLLERGAIIDIRAEGFTARTALQAAVEEGDLKLAKRLLELGADVNALPAKDSGATALQLAAIHGYIEIARVLLEAGAEVNAEGAERNGRTALEAAAEHGRLDMVHLFLTLSQVSGTCQQTYAKAMNLASREDHHVVADMIREHMENPRSSTTSDGQEASRDRTDTGIQMEREDRDHRGMEDLTYEEDLRYLRYLEGLGGVEPFIDSKSRFSFVGSDDEVFPFFLAILVSIR